MKSVDLSSDVSAFLDILLSNELSQVSAPHEPEQWLQTGQFTEKEIASNGKVAV